MPIVITFVILPLLDEATGVSVWNPDPDEERALQADPRYRWITWAWLPVGAATTFCGIFYALGPQWSWLERAGLASGIGLMNGVAGIVYAHELVHRSERFERLIGEAMLTLCTYTHFRIEHVFGHHRFVATPRDPATARFGETFYAFLPRSVLGQIASAWALEAERLTRVGRRIWSAENHMLWYAAALLAVYTTLFFTGGWVAAILFALQSFVAFGSLEVINYLEHYGLVRRAIGPDRYESVGPQHSWNSGHRVSNKMLINLARHSDHHANATRRYQILRTYSDAEAPQLPSGYAAMYCAALVPPLWFAVMNPRVRRWEATWR